MCAACRLSRRWIVALWCGGGLLLLFGFLPSALVTWISKPDTPPVGVTNSWEKRQFILQTLAGNWSPPEHTILSAWWFAFSAILAVVLNYAPWLAVVLYLRTVWRRRMTFREALDAFEVAARAHIIKRLEESPPTSQEERAARIDEGLAEGRKAALPIIQAVGGTEAVAGWQAMQERQI